MAYQSLYRRYRPRRFSEVRGQQHLVDALRNAVVDDRIGHAYLFSGPRGTGKTSTARILAKVLNCEAAVDGEPCCECASCLSIETGSSFDVHELDAASNNGVDAIRELIARASLGTPGRTKVYILDEVHMLSTAASNALLKTLEEPPDHVVFVLATTDPQKVLPTIRSRTQHFEVRLLSAADLEGLVDYVVADAGLELSPEGRSHVLRVGAGSARDTLSALDRVVAAGGVPDANDSVDELVEALCERDTARALIAVEAALSRGRSPRVLGESLISRLRDVFLAAVGADLSRLTDTDRERAVDQAGRLSAVGATRALEALGEAFVGIQDALDPRIPLEVALVRLTRIDADTSVAALAERITRLEQGLPAGGGAAARPAPATTDRGSARAPAADASPARAGRDAADDADAADAMASQESPTESAQMDAARDASGGRPADGAREVLRQRNAGSGRPVARPAPASPSPDADAATAAPARTAPPSRSGNRRPPAPSAGATTTTRSAPSASSTAPDPSVRTGAEPAPASGQRTPDVAAASAADAHSDASAQPVAGLTLDSLSAIWSSTVLSSLSQRARPRYAAGRWLAVQDSTATLGLPNAPHAARCEELRSEVEAALSKAFSGPVTVRLTVDSDAVDPGDRGAVLSSTARARAQADAPEDILDSEAIAQLDNADSTATSGLDRVAAIFPGAELLAEPEA